MSDDRQVRVHKYGGTSVADPERIRSVARRLVAARQQGTALLVVVSALGDTTDRLIALAHEVSARPSRRELDMLLATGEQAAAALLAMAVQDLGQEAVALTASQAGIQTDNVYSRARILDIDTGRLRRELARRIVVVAGFQGVTAGNDITTLGRGGSDTTAVALAAALGAPACDIFTDVDGVFSADPRVVRQAVLLPRISYDEMLELAARGARVLHLRAVELAKTHGVPLHVRSSFHGRPGTLVGGEHAMEKGPAVVGVAHDEEVAKLTIAGVSDRPGIAAEVFGGLAAEDVNVGMIVQSAGRDGMADISFTVARHQLEAARRVMERQAQRMEARGLYEDDGVAKLSVVGAGMISHPGVAARMFGALAEHGINIEMISTSDISISCIVRAAHIEQAAQVVHDTFQLQALHDDDSESA